MVLTTYMSETKSPTTPRRAMVSVVHNDRAECIWTAGQPVTGCRTRAAALDSSLLAALATITVEKIVLAILRRIEERWQPCQEKTDEGKQETYAYRLSYRREPRPQ